MVKRKVARNYVSKSNYQLLTQLTIPEELATERQLSFPYSPAGEEYGKLKLNEVYEQLLGNTFFIASPEVSKNIAECQKRGTKLIVEKRADEKYYFTGWVIHHAMTKNGGYCGQLQFFRTKKIRTSDLNRHMKSCECGKHLNPDLPSGSNQPEIPFQEKRCAKLSHADVKKLNKSITEFILSSLRPYELANEPFLTDVVARALEVGASYGARNFFHFDLKGDSNVSQLITADGVRMSLDKVDCEVVGFQSPLLSSAHTKGLTSYYTDIGKDKVNNRAMLNICATVTFPALLDIPFDLVLATCSYNSALLEAAESEEDGDDIDLNELANEIYSKNATNILATFRITLRKFGIDPSGDYYIVADRAAPNVAAFGRSYICCQAHQLDLAFKQAINELAM